MTRRTWSLLACLGWGASWVAVGEIMLVEMTSCTDGSTDSWLVSLLAGVPLAAIAAALLLAARPHAASTRWLALPHAILMPPAILLAARYAALSTLHGLPLCAIATGDGAFAAAPRQWWNRWWAPLQAGVLIAVAALIYAYWHRRRADDRRQ
jgi:uncharacterized membrane protein SpoIIM required for sporulation